MYLGEELRDGGYLKSDLYENEYDRNVDFIVNSYLIVKDVEYNIVCVIIVGFVGEVSEEKILFISEIKEIIELVICVVVSEVDIGRSLFF